jgi:hypothetical protein
MKILNGSAFENFRKFFKPKLEKCFMVQGNTFDNVKGDFPIGFKIWDTNVIEEFKEIYVDMYDSNNCILGKKVFCNIKKDNVINKWISAYKIKSNNSDHIGFLAGINGNDFQQNKIVYILNHRTQMANPRGMEIFEKNLAECSIYFAVRHSIDYNWFNDRDQYLFPNDNYKTDHIFKTDCLIFTLFNNNIQSKNGINHWIPFTENEVDAKSNFESNFMSKYLKDKTFSPEARSVLSAGLELWKYYHAKIKNNKTASVNASFYDIREFFQGRKESGAMNTKSADETYNALIKTLRDAHKALAEKIAPKVYEYGFLKE